LKTDLSPSHVRTFCRAVEHDQDGTRSILVLFEICLQTCMTYTIAESTVSKLLMMDRGTVRNMESFMPKYICEISASSWFYCKEICYDARSHARKKYTLLLLSVLVLSKNGDGSFSKDNTLQDSYLRCVAEK
jgi:hypothetical protein